MVFRGSDGSPRLADFNSGVAAWRWPVVDAVCLLAHGIQFHETDPKRIRITPALGGCRCGALCDRSLDRVSTHADARNDAFNDVTIGVSFDAETRKDIHLEPGSEPRCDCNVAYGDRMCCFHYGGASRWRVRAVHKVRRSVRHHGIHHAQPAASRPG